MKKLLYALFLVFSISLIILGSILYFRKNKEANNSSSQNSTENSKESLLSSENPSESKKEIHQPIDNAKERITKKPFGMYITPKTSPVQPEKFTGFHTGTDFEIIGDELGKEVSVYAICSGRI